MSSRVAVVCALGFTSIESSFYQQYVQDVQAALDEIDPDTILFVEKYRIDTGDKEEVYFLRDTLATACVGRSCFVLEPGITTLQNIDAIKLCLQTNISHPLTTIHTIAPNMMIYQKLFLMTKHLAPLVGIQKTEHDLYEAVIDILRSLDMEELINARVYKLGKLYFHSIAGDRPLREIYRQIISGMREMVGDQYPDIDKEYTKWRKNQLS